MQLLMGWKGDKNDGYFCGVMEQRIIKCDWDDNWFLWSCNCWWIDKETKMMAVICVGWCNDYCQVWLRWQQVSVVVQLLMGWQGDKMMVICVGWWNEELSSVIEMAIGFSGRATVDWVTRRQRWKLLVWDDVNKWSGNINGHDLEVTH